LRAARYAQLSTREDPVAFLTRESDSSLHAHAGEPFDVDLGAPPTTGYGWEITHIPPGVELLDGTGEAASDGAPQVFRLVASHPGRFELRFLLKRRWEQEPIEIRLVEVEAH
jgi:predicted secreted protein